jgi:hypothetical protein
MKSYVQILQIEDGRAIVEITDSKSKSQGSRDELIDLPLAVLPDKSRVGDILQLHISFCPYKTLSST